MKDNNDLQDLKNMGFDNQMVDLSSHESDLPTLSSKIESNGSQESNYNNNNILDLKEPPSSISSSDQQDQQQPKPTDPTQKFISKLLCVFSFIRPYFKITYKDVKQRVISSFKPINNSFFEIAQSKPDLYGPFWIYTTLIYVIAAGGALSYYFTKSNSQNYFQLFVPVAGTILYTFGFGFPLAFWLCLKFFGVLLKYVTVICIYGYSLTCFIPVLIICSCGFGWVQWLFLTYAILNSTGFVLINLWNLIKGMENKKKYIFIGVLVTCQLIFYLTVKLYFFGSFTSEDNKSTSGLNNNTNQNTNTNVNNPTQN